MKENLHAQDSVYLQNLLDSSDDVTIPRENPLSGDELWEISAPLLLHSNLHIMLDGAHLRLADGVYANIFTTDFPHGEGPGKYENIHIHGKNGALLDGGNHNGLTEKTSEKEGRPHIRNNIFIFMRGVTGFSVTGLHLCNPRYWGMAFYYCAQGYLADIEFTAFNDTPNQDGIDLRVGCHDIVIENITGSTGDDTVALTGLCGHSKNRLPVPGLSRDIHHVLIRNIHTYVTGGHGIVRLLCHDGIRLHHVTVSDIYDGSLDCDGVRCQAAIRIGDSNYAAERPAEDTDYEAITVTHVKTNSPTAIRLHGNPTNFSCSDIETTAENGMTLRHE